MKLNATAIGKVYRIIHVILNLCLWPRMIGLWDGNHHQCGGHESQRRCGGALDQSFEKYPVALVTELENIMMKMAKARDTGAFELYLDLDSDFHDAFFNHCGNHYLCEGYNKVSDMVKTMRTYLSKTSDRITKSYEEHQAITELLKDGKLKAAKTVLKTQITRGERASADLLQGVKL